MAVVDFQTIPTASNVLLYLSAIGQRFATALLPRLFGKTPMSHHKGATGRVRIGIQQLPVLCHCQLGQDIPILFVWLATITLHNASCLWWTSCVPDHAFRIRMSFYFSIPISHTHIIQQSVDYAHRDNQADFLLTDSAPILPQPFCLSNLTSRACQPSSAPQSDVTFVRHLLLWRHFHLSHWPGLSTVSSFSTTQT